MATTNSELMNKVSGVNKPVPVANQVHNYLEKMKGEIARALPKHMSVDRMTRLAMTEMRINPKLLECSIESLMGSIMKSAQYGLEIGTGEAYLVPYFNNKTRKLEAQFQAGYKGLLKLVRNTKLIKNPCVYPVFSKDIFELQLGTEAKVIHKPCLDEDRGEVKGYYFTAEHVDGGFYVEWMSIAEVLRIRGRSKSKDSGPWVTDEIEMGRKTLAKRACKYLPMSTDVAELIEHDNRIEFGDSLADIDLGEMPKPLEINVEKGNGRLPVVEMPTEAMEPEELEGAQ